MFAVDRRLLQNFDWGLCGIALLLSGIGIVNLISAAPGGLGETGSIAWRQALLLGVGLCAMSGLLLIDYRAWDRLALPAYAGCVLLLVAVLVVGDVVKGSQRWLVAGSLRIQPSELAKFALVVLLARAVHRRRPTPTARVRELAARYEEWAEGAAVGPWPWVIRPLRRGVAAAGISGLLIAASLFSRLWRPRTAARGGR